MAEFWQSTPYETGIIIKAKIKLYEVQGWYNAIQSRAELKPLSDILNLNQKIDEQKSSEYLHKVHQAKQQARKMLEEHKKHALLNK